MKTLKIITIVIMTMILKLNLMALEPANTTTIVSVNFNSDFNLISIPVSLNGKDSLHFIIDTGFDVNVLDENVAKELGIDLSEKISQAQPGGTIEFALAGNIDLSINQVEMEKENFIVTQISQMGNIVGIPIHGILGIDFLAKYIVEIDYDQNNFTIHKPNSKVETNGFTELQISLIDDEPFIYCDLQNANNEQIKGKFKMDTGGIDAIGFNKNFIDNNSITNENTPLLYKKGIAVGGETLGIEFRLKELTIIDYVIQNILVGATIESGGFENRNDAGTIGGDILSRFHWILDFSNGISYLKPGSSFNKDFHSDRSGLWVIDNGMGDKMVFQVLADTPAAESGLLRGQIINEINGIDASKYSLFQIWQMLRDPSNSEISFKIQDIENPISLKLKNLI